MSATLTVAFGKNLCQTCAKDGHFRASLSRGGLEKLFDFVHFLIAKPQFPGTHDSVGLTGISRSDNCPGNRWIAQRPGDGDFSRKPIVALCNLAKAVNQFQVAG